MMDEVNIERVRGGYIVSYFNHRHEYVREVYGNRTQAMFAVDALLADYEVARPLS